MTNKASFLAVALGMLAASAAYFYLLNLNPNRASTKADQAVVPIRAGTRHETRHYAISSTATAAQTQLVGGAVDSLHDAYLDFFSDSLKPDQKKGKLSLTLYRDRQEFKRNNRSSAWAEAYYLAPNCYAYYAEGEANPYHWMLHEATHQLNHEVAQLQKRKWMDEGLATYFSASTIRNNRLMLGDIDSNAYPIWWLSSLELTGRLEADLASGRIIPLRALISGVGGPDIAKNVNQYYIGYWSLSHFLFHYADGRYAKQYRQLIAAGGSLESFESLIGPVEQIQTEWYQYLQQQADGQTAQKLLYVIDNDAVSIPE